MVSWLNDSAHALHCSDRLLLFVVAEVHHVHCDERFVVWRSGEMYHLHPRSAALFAARSVAVVCSVGSSHHHHRLAWLAWCVPWR